MYKSLAGGTIALSTRAFRENCCCCLVVGCWKMFSLMELLRWYFVSVFGLGGLEPPVRKVYNRILHLSMSIDSQFVVVFHSTEAKVVSLSEKP